MRRIERVAIVGRDADLWLAALALHRALSPLGVAVEAIELPSSLSPFECYSAAPSLSGLHDLLGIDRHGILAASAGVPVSGQRFSGWSRTPFVYGYDAKRAAIHNVDILQYWIKARAEGLALPLDRLSVAALAANLGRVGPDGQSPSEFGTVHRGYHVDASAYVDALRGLATKRGIAARVGGQIAAVRSHGERIEQLTLVDGSRVEADLFVDASGTEATLAARQPRDDWQSWKTSLPVDRLAFTSAPPLRPAPSFADIRATPTGWVGLFPLANRTAIAAAFAAGTAIEETIAGAVGLAQLPAPLVRQFDPGMRSAWRGNVVAIGGAAAALPPLDLMQLHLTHAGITNLIALFPAQADAMPEATSYNRVIGRYAGNVRDFMAAHYSLNERIGEAFWDEARGRAETVQLQARLSLFAARGLVPAFDEDSFDEGLWSNLLVGHGLVPRGYDPKVDAVDRSDVAARLQRLIDLVDEKARAMPTIAEYLAS